MQQTLAVFNQPFHQIEAPSQPLVSKSCGLSSGVSQRLHGNCQFLSAKKAASTLQSTSCYNLRFAQGWRGSTKIGWNFSTTSQKLKIYLRKLPTVLNLLAEIKWQAENPSPEFGILVEFFLWVGEEDRTFHFGFVIPEAVLCRRAFASGHPSHRRKLQRRRPVSGGSLLKASRWLQVRAWCIMIFGLCIS